MINKINSKIEIISELNIEKAPVGAITRYWLEIVEDGMGMPIHLPIIIAKGKSEGKTIGLTVAIHGNELNGIPVI
jgi:predicted deacylase